MTHLSRWKMNFLFCFSKSSDIEKWYILKYKMLLRSDVWSEQRAAVCSLIQSQWLFRSSAFSTYHFQMHCIGTYSVIAGHFSPTHRFVWYYLQQCHSEAQTRSGAYITVVCNCNFQIFLIELVADTQYICPCHTLSQLFVLDLNSNSQ